MALRIIHISHAFLLGLFLVLAGVAFVVSYSSAESGSEGRTLVYYGLGDSVASGYGLAGQSGPCKRAPGAYPVVASSLLRDRLVNYDDVVLKFLACSGAESSTLYGQIDEVLSDLQAQQKAAPVDGLVSITVGADLFGWTELPQIRHVLCLRHDDFVEEISEIVGMTKTNVQGQIARLLASDNTYVIVTDFYNPMNRTSKYLRWFRSHGPFGESACRRLTVKELYARTETAIHLLNDALGSAVSVFPSDRVRLVRIHEAFHGHEGPWPQCGWSLPGPRKSWIQAQECFHPNIPGVAVFAEAIATEALELLGHGATPQTSASRP